MTVQEALKNSARYDITTGALENIAIARGLSLDETATMALLNSSSYKLAVADAFKWIAKAPNITEGGVKIDLPDKAREILLSDANTIYTASSQSTTYGYKGENF